MYTYNDLQAVGANETDRINFIQSVINDHERSLQYRTGKVAGEFYRHRNPDIEKIERVFYDFQGISHPDTVSANHQLTSNFYFILTVQAVSYLLGNSVSFDNPEIKEKLGGNSFDFVLQDLLTYAMNDGVSYGYVTENRIIPFNFACDNREPHFVGLLDENDSVLKAGVRYWRIAPDKPLKATLYEPDGYTEYQEDTESTDPKNHGNNSGQLVVVQEKRPYGVPIENEIQGVYTFKSGNFSGIPIVPMNYINGQSQLVGNRATLVAYDLILSGLVNNVSDGQILYWVIQNAEAMDEYDDKKMLLDIIKSHVLHLPESVTAEPHQIETSYAPNETTLTRLRSQIFNDFMAVDWERVSAGNMTTVEIKSAYTQLNLKCDMLEKCISEFIREVLKIHGFDENEPFHFQRATPVNESETIQNIIASAPFIGEETATKKICEVLGMIDEFENIQARKTAENMAVAGLIQQEQTENQAELAPKT